MLELLRILLRDWSLKPSSPINLAVCRIIIFGSIFGFFQFGKYGSIDFDDPWIPTSYYQSLDLGPLSEETYAVFVLAIKLSLICGVVGFFTKTNSLISFVLGWYLLGLENNFGKVSHGMVLILFSLASLAFSRCGDAISIDAWWRNRFHAIHTTHLISGEYTWPLRFFQVLFCLCFMSAGLSKLRATGLDWVVTDNMQNILRMHFFCGHKPVLDWGRWMSEIPWLCQCMAALALISETFAPLALVSRRCRLLLIPGLFGMQVGIYLLMGVFAYPWLITYVFWIPWEQLGKRISKFGRSLFAKAWPAEKTYLPAH